MTKLIFITYLIFSSVTGMAQADSAALYLQYPTIPYFTITKVDDSTRFSRADLAPGKATIIFVFSPDCGHCQQKIRSVIDNKALFAKAQIIMASPIEYRIIKKFYEEYEIARYPNIVMGNDPGYFLGSFYSVKKLPAIFVYDKNGRLADAFDDKSPIEEIAKAL